VNRKPATPAEPAQQPASVFLSHGVSLLAADDTWPSTRALQTTLQPIGRAAPAIVIVSAHWQADTISITAEEHPPIFDEGLPTGLLDFLGPFVGSPALARNLAERLTSRGLAARLVEGRGLDHGATIALRFLSPPPTTPVVQISLHQDAEPGVHLKIGQALRDLGALVVTSGGAVHNLATLERFAPYGTPPPEWAEQFQTMLHRAATSENAESELQQLMLDPRFRLAHPTPEHFLPILVNAGLGGTATLIHHGWQWSSLAMTTYTYQR
jgi:4,5-DOPA dioxygenase extradiol